MRRPLLFALVLAALLPAAGAARARPVALGVFGPPDRFQALTGQRSQVHHVIFGWGQASFAQVFDGGETPMIGFDAGGLTPLAIARGAGDTFLVALNAYAAHARRPVYVRPLGEMNGHWNAYCAFDQNGSARGSAYSTAAFRKAFARIYLLAHGGRAAQLDARLRRLGLPPFGHDLLQPNVRVIWNPQGYGSPDVPGNRAAAYYPGDAYVDVIGDDLYDIRFDAEWEAAEALYRAHPHKPFAFPEWGLWGIDDPRFVEQMATFVRTHARVEMLAYYNAKPGSIFDLASKPRSRAAYRRLIVPLGG